MIQLSTEVHYNVVSAVLEVLAEIEVKVSTSDERRRKKGRSLMISVFVIVESSHNEYAIWEVCIHV